MKQSQFIAPAIVGVVALAAGFLGGIKYQQSKTPIFSGQMGFRNGNGTNPPGGRRMFGAGMQAVRGEVIDQDDKGVTVKMLDGSSKVVIFSNSTTFSKAQTATKTDVKKGDTVIIFGSNNSDGSVTANNVQLNPENFRLPNTQPSPTPGK